MKYTREKIDTLLNQYGAPLNIFDEKGFIENFKHLYGAMSSLYCKYRAAYSFKTNYVPYICKTVKKLGAYAEVVSEMEYDLARRLGFPEEQIIFNGPDKGAAGIEAFLRGSIVNVDHPGELKEICTAAQNHPEQEYKIGFRVSLDIGQGFISRFGMDEADLKKAFRMVSETENLKVSGLHCHISRCRGRDAWKKRTEYMLSLADQYFSECPEYIDLGSGMFGSMAPEFASQFTDVPMYEEYADVTAGILAGHYKDTEGPVLFTEPGTTLINRFVDCVTLVKAIKSINGHSFAVLDASIHNLGETALLKRLPVQVIPGGKTQAYYESIDLTGYTCLEQDVLLPDFRGNLAEGDYVVFENTGGYSTVLKPPFIRPNCAMIAVKPDGETELIKRRETNEDVFRTYIL